MKLSNTKLAKQASLIALDEQVSMKVLPMKDMMELFSNVQTEDGGVNLEGVNDIFDLMVVDSKGNKFEDLKGQKATDVLDLKTVMSILELITAELNPAGK